MCAHAVGTYIINSDDWGTSQFKLIDLPKTVTRLHFAAHANIDNVGDHAGGEEVSPTNHWSLFLETGIDSVVQMDVVPNELGKPGMIILESKNSEEADIIHTVSTETAVKVAVTDILSLIISRNRDHYIFMHSGEGCRFWLYTLAQDLVAANFISDHFPHEAHPALVKYWPYPPGVPPVDRKMARGQFPKSSPSAA